MSLLPAARSIENGVHYFNVPEGAFENAYLSVRRKEDRLYTDAEVRRLPYPSAGHPHRAEWRLRQQSFRRLKKYFDRTENNGPVLDLGCGNGWLTRHLGDWFGEEVIGLDVNRTELEQAARVNPHAHATFVYGNIFEVPFPGGAFRHIVLNASAQYFPSLEDLLDRLLQLLTPGGEIHILDTPFYKPEELDAARQRTQAYYRQMEREEMARHYHHRNWAELAGFDHELLYTGQDNWSRLLRRLHLKRNPFPWVRIRKKSLAMAETGIIHYL